MGQYKESTAEVGDGLQNWKQGIGISIDQEKCVTGKSSNMYLAFPVKTVPQGKQIVGHRFSLYRYSLFFYERNELEFYHLFYKESRQGSLTACQCDMKRYNRIHVP